MLERKYSFRIVQKVAFGVNTNVGAVLTMTNKAPVLVYSVYDRDIPIEHARVATFINPIGERIEDRREEHEKTVASCEGDRCTIRSNDAAFNE